MSNHLADWYSQTKKKLAIFEKEKEGNETEDILKMVEELREVITIIERDNPDVVRTYERKKAIQESFTPEQVDFICYEIGEWYCEWKEKMWVKDKPNQHWLGTAKEQLKAMICGD